MISVLILTKNEELDLGLCLESVSWSDDIHVFDSYSEDKTVDIAAKAGAKVTQRKFDGYAAQRNAALNTLSYKYPWLLILDADERIPFSLVPQLMKELQNVPDTIDGFRLRRRDYMGNVWLKHSQISPFFIRLVRLGKASYKREINEVLQVEGEVRDINAYFDHYPFSKGFKHWIAKHNQYSPMEALVWIEEQKSDVKFSIKSALFERDFNKRRFHQKGLFYKLPGRPIIKWFYMLVVRRAFLDGRAGITYATLQSIYEYFIILKSRELFNAKNNLN